MTHPIKSSVVHISVPFYDIDYSEVGDWHVYIAIAQNTARELIIQKIVARNPEEAERAFPDKLIHLEALADIIADFIPDGKIAEIKSL